MNWNKSADVAENHFSSVKSLKQTTQIPATWLPNDTQLRGFFDKTKGFLSYKSFIIHFFGNNATWMSLYDLETSDHKIP